QHNLSQRRRLTLDDEHRTGRMMDQIRRYAAEHEPVESVEALATHYQEPLTFGRTFQERRCNRPLLLADRALELQQCQLLVSLLECFARTRFHALNFFLDVPFGTGYDRLG